MKPLIKKLITYCLYLLLLLVLLVLFLSVTTTGLKVNVRFLSYILPGTLTIQRVDGKLLGNMTFEGIKYTDTNRHIKSDHLSINWSPSSVFSPSIQINQIVSKNTTINSINTSPSTESNTITPKDPFQFPTIRPIHFNLKMLTIKQLMFINGETKTHIPSITLKASSNAHQLLVDSFLMTLDNAKINANGTLLYEKDLPVDATLHATGDIQSTTHLHGNIIKYVFDTTVKKPIKLSFSTTLNDLNAIKIDANISDAYWPLRGDPQYFIKNTLAQLTGSITDYTLSANGSFKKLKFPWLTFKANGHGNLKEFIIKSLTMSDGQGNLSATGKLQWLPYPKWNATATIKELNVTPYYPFIPGQLNISVVSEGERMFHTWTTNNKIQADGYLLNQALHANANVNIGKNSTALIQLGKNKLQLHGNFNLPLNVELMIPDTLSVTPDFSFLKSRLHLKGTLSDHSNAELSLSPGFLLFKDGTKIPMRGGNFMLSFDQKTLVLNGALTIDANKKVSIHAKLPNFSPDLNKQTLDATLSASLNDLSLLDKFIEETKHSKGQINLKVHLTGHLLSPTIETNGQLKNASTSIKSLGITINPINLSINGTNDHWKIQGALHSGSGKLNLSGQGSYLASHLKTELHLQGNNVSVMNTREYKIKASPQLQLNMDNTDVTISGKIFIPEANIHPDNFSETIDLPEDVVIINGPHTRRSRFNTTYHLNVSLGNDVNLDVNGLSGKVKGGIKIDALPKQQSRANGELHIVLGKYNAYGQKLKIINGALIYSGGPLNNPGISLTATRQFETNSQFSSYATQSNATNLSAINDFETLTVGIRVSGRLKSPKITLFSNPASKSQADILSLLLLGRPASQAGDTSGGSQLLLGAVSSMNLGHGTKGQQLTEQLQHALGIDSLSIENQQIYNRDTGTVSDNPSLVIGKALSSKVFIQYSAGLAQGSNIMRITYKINKEWSLQSESDGASSGIDVFYNFHRE